MVLAEREEQLARLRELYRASREGNGHTAVVSGPVAVGKTELLRAFAADPGGERPLHLHAIATRTERGVPLGVARQLLPAVALSATADNPYEAAMALLSVIERAQRPVLISVDDAHLADPTSLQCLASVARRLRSVRALVVLTQVPSSASDDPLVAVELPPEPLCVRIALNPLSAEGVAALLAADPAAVVSAPDIHAASGGSPMLAHALHEDLKAAAHPGELVIGASFGRALLGALHRCEGPTLRTARALAVLGAPAQPVNLTTLTEMDSESCARALRTLDETGLLVHGRFTHPAVPELVLRDMPVRERSELHSLAAPMLYADGAPPRVVARCLLAAKVPDASWVVPLLHEAAEQAMVVNEPGEAVRFLRLARHLAVDDLQRHATTALLVQAEWQADPATAAHHLTAMVEAADGNGLSIRHTLALVDQLLWFGRIDEAVKTIRQLTGMQDVLTPVERKRLYAAEVWLSCLYPSLGRRGIGSKAPTADGAGRTFGPDPALESARLLGGLVSQKAAAEQLADAERALRRGHLDEHTVILCATALLTLTYQNRLGLAQEWCEQLIARSDSPHTAMWHALFTAVRAEIALQRGDLRGAAEHARAALDLIPAASWGIRVAVPLSVLVQAEVALGRLEEADSLLHVPVPEAMFQSPIGLYYLQARGRYLYAIGKYDEALEDFRTVGELLEQWHVEPQPFVSWRIDAARVQLAMRRPTRARQLANEEMDRTAFEDARTRGACLRVLAATSDSGKQIEVYEQAVEALSGCEAPLQLADALAEFADVLDGAGVPERAAECRERARLLARECGVQDPYPLSAPAAGVPGAGAASVSSASGRSAPLSDAEHRVASQAAAGYSNRQIAKKLFITVSTVEQHLTRVYRKLGVTRRSELAAAYRTATV
ncbi:LuxR C-terminal-related transcriptional regulator [Streptomyces sp. NPDC102441]|uniref:helix-turn-helix transcriptional regulator n=1 Tax=Streptomyces sp. NPDC102441 TaxID=3366176 RepID=UPI0037F17795